MNRLGILSCIVCAVVVLTIPPFTEATLYAAEDSAARQMQMPQYVETVLGWLPEDTETLVVAREIVKKQGKSSITVNRMGESIATGPILKPADELLAERELAWAVHGGRNFKYVSAFGTVRQEGASVIQLAEKLHDSDLERWHKKLGSKCAKTLKMGQHVVYAFPFDRRGTDGWAKTQPWQGRFVVLVNAETVVKASSDRYLKQVLSRMDASDQASNEDDAPPRALPASLQEWKYVDFTAHAWLVRHVPVPAESKTLSLKGIVWTSDRETGTHKAGLRVYFIPLEGKSVTEVAKSRWIDPETKAISKDVEPFLVFKQIEDDVVEFSFGLSALDPEDPADKKRTQELVDNLDQEAKIKLAMFGVMFPYTSQGMKR